MTPSNSKLVSIRFLCQTWIFTTKILNQNPFLKMSKEKLHSQFVPTPQKKVYIHQMSVHHQLSTKLHGDFFFSPPLKRNLAKQNTYLGGIFVKNGLFSFHFFSWKKISGDFDAGGTSLVHLGRHLLRFWNQGSTLVVCFFCFFLSPNKMEGKKGEWCLDIYIYTYRYIYICIYVSGVRNVYLLKTICIIANSKLIVHGFGMGIRRVLKDPWFL